MPFLVARSRAVSLPAALFLLTAAAAPIGGTLTIDVSNVRNARGRVHVDICPEARFLKDDCPYSASAPARAGVTRVVVSDLPAGTYAVQAFHDENGNGKADRGFLGLPKEGIGFSNDAPIRMAPPRWADARFVFAGGDKAIALRMRYFGGASGPAGR